VHVAQRLLRACKRHRQAVGAPWQKSYPPRRTQVRKTALREVQLLQALRHAHIVALLDVFRRQGRLYLVFEFVERTVLEDLERHPRGLGDRATRRIMWQLVKSVEYLHSQQVGLPGTAPRSARRVGLGWSPEAHDAAHAACLLACCAAQQTEVRFLGACSSPVPQGIAHKIARSSLLHLAYPQESGLRTPAQHAKM